MIDSDKNVPTTKGIYPNDIDNSRTILRDSFAKLIDENDSTRDLNKNYSFSLEFNQKNIILLLFISKRIINCKKGLDLKKTRPVHKTIN